MKKRNIIYILITIICVISIFAGVYYQIFENGDKNQNTVIYNQINNNGNDENSQDPEVIKEQFNSLFTNSFDDQGYSKNKAEKVEGYEANDIIYNAYTINEEKDGKYSIKMSIPAFNIKGEIGTKFNNITKSVFVDKASEIFQKSQNYTIYNVEYFAYLNENILSLVIKSTLKEGNTPQRIIVQTYNYDIANKKELTLNEILELKGINQRDVNKKIEVQVKEANKQAEAISQALIQSGQKVFIRDIDNAMYVTDNVKYFFVGLDGEIYIIYPYGNSDFTSEMDIIKI